MPHFDYVGRDPQGEKVSGDLERSDKNAVAQYLLSQNITPISIHPSADKKESNSPAGILEQLKKSKVSDEQLIMFCRQMYTITKSGLPLAQGIRNLSVTLPDGDLKESLLETVEKLQSGYSLSACLLTYPKIFNTLFVSMIRVGESSGQLDEVFKQLADYLERDYQSRLAVKTAFRYPSFVLIAMVVALGVVNVFVIPAFSDMFSRFGAQLPLPTRILVGISEFSVNYWWLIILIGVITTVLFWKWIQTDNGRLQFDKQKLQLPIVGNLVQTALLARYARSFSVMFRAGVPLTEAIGLCVSVLDNRFMTESLSGIRRGIERGDTLLRTHTKAGVFNPLILQMIAIGESSGQIDTLLLDVAEHYERDVDYRLKKLSSLIEPLLIICMAGFVLILALGIFLPMWDLYAVQK